MRKLVLGWFLYGPASFPRAGNGNFSRCPQAPPELIHNWGYKTLYNRCRRWSDNDVFEALFTELARSDGTETGEVSRLDATYGKAHGAASSLKKEALKFD